MKPTFLFLRPFWESDSTAKHLEAICQATKPLGNLVAIKNGTEETKLRPKNNRGSSKEESSLWAKIHEKFKTPLNIELVEATDDTWQEQVIRQINRVDVVLVNLAPRKGDGFQDFEQIQPSYKGML